MNEESSAIVVELAKEFINALHQQYPKWREGYFRFSSEAFKYGSNGSCVHETGIELLDPFANAEVFARMNENGVKLFELFGKTQGVFLLKVDSSFKYDIQFDFENMARWRISKVNGGTGLPADS